MHSGVKSVTCKDMQAETQASLLRARIPSRGRRRQPQTHSVCHQHRRITTSCSAEDVAGHRGRGWAQVLTRKHLWVRTNRQMSQDIHFGHISYRVMILAWSRDRVHSQPLPAVHGRDRRRRR